MKLSRWLGIILLGGVAAVPSLWSQSYVFTTWSGQPAPGVEDGAVERARFRFPVAVAVDRQDNVYVADTENHTIRKITPSGVVTTLAGQAGQKGNGDGRGAGARFNLPSGLAVDAAGVVYVADTNNNTIRRITPDGQVTTWAGSGRVGSADGTGLQASFNQLQGLALDAAGNLVVADRFNHTIRRVTPAGVVTTLAGRAGQRGTTDGPAAEARFEAPRSVAVDAAGNIIIADTENDTLRKLTPEGVVSTIAGKAGTASTTDGPVATARLASPHGVAVDAEGNIWFSQYTMHVLRKLTPAGVVTTVAGVASILNAGGSDGQGPAARFSGPKGLAVDSQGQVLVADATNCGIRRVTSGGMVSTLAGRVASRGYEDGAVATARWNSPQGLACDGVGNLYVADYNNRVIRRITPAGEVSTVAGLAGQNGTRDGPTTTALLHQPIAVAADGEGNLYVADFSANTVRKVTRAGMVTTLAGQAMSEGSADGAGAVARFRGLEGIAVDGTGVVYVADTFNHTIRKITPAGVVTTLAGTAGQTGSADGTGVAARFYMPRALCVDRAGVIYVADTGNFTIRKITPAGVVTTLAGTAGRVGYVDGKGAQVRLGEMWNLAVDAAGQLYFADSTNDAVRRVAPDGTVSTLGGGVMTGLADGIGAAASFYNPQGLAVDPQGRIYVSDTDNNIIRIGQPLDNATTSKLVNLSVRADVVTSQRLIVGFVVNGGGQPVMVRAIGPGLAPYLPPLSPVARNPVVEVFDGAGTQVDRNDDWGGGAALVAAFSQVGAFPLFTTSQDAVVMRTMAGVYSAHFIAQSDGIGLMEAYEAGTSGEGRLVNLSARYRAGSGASTLIAGFTIGGVGPKTLLVRGIGPQLGKYGVPGSLGDPRLEVFSATQKRVAENDNWATTLATSFARVSAFAFEGGSLDAALLVTLPPGVYSAQVSGADGGTGEAMVEVYEIR